MLKDLNLSSLLLNVSRKIPEHEDAADTVVIFYPKGTKFVFKKKISLSSCPSISSSTETLRPSVCV